METVWNKIQKETEKFPVKHPSVSHSSHHSVLMYLNVVNYYDRYSAKGLIQLKEKTVKALLVVFYF